MPLNKVTKSNMLLHSQHYFGSERGVVANVVDSDIIVIEFEFHWCYYFHFSDKYTSEMYEPLIPQLLVQFYQ